MKLMQRIVELLAHRFNIGDRLHRDIMAIGKIYKRVLWVRFRRKSSRRQKRLQHPYRRVYERSGDIIFVTARYRCHQSHRGSSHQDRQSQDLSRLLHLFFTPAPEARYLTLC